MEKMLSLHKNACAGNMGRENLSRRLMRRVEAQESNRKAYEIIWLFLIARGLGNWSVDRVGGELEDPALDLAAHAAIPLENRAFAHHQTG